uniref:Uncharacterized protein n=1 Tax=Sphaerodactylus townsendi TaxID=933632 RepID=A0ACB8G6L1_9SAUR
MAGRSSLEELELTGEEARRLREAFRDEGFRSLFAEYAAELADPAQRAVYEAEVVALERQRGVEARFLHPAPGWVLRTSQAGSRRCYLNVCGNALVGRPEARRAPGGACWSLPHCLSPGREELGRGPGAPRRLVYDVVFHPDALRLAARSARFRRLVDETALEAVERRFSPGLDRANAVPLRGTKYKGVPQATLLRTPLPGGAPPEAGGEGGSPLPPFPTPYAYPPPAPGPEPAAPTAPTAPTAPRWTLRQRCYVDLQDYRCSRDSAPSPVPRELEVAVELPLLSSAAQAQLEVRGRELRLDSRRPAAAYRLRLPLPYPVDEDGGRAAFDKSRRRLVVTLPVRPREEGQGPGGEQQQQDPPASGRSPSSPAEQPGPLTHVAANHVQLPACAEESGPAADRGGEGATAAEACPGPLAGHLGSALEPLGDLETAAPGAADSNLCDRSPGASASEGGGGGDKGHEAGPIPLDPQVCVGRSLELPVCCSITSPPPPPGTEVGPCATMDLEKCPAVTDVVPSPELGDATLPATVDATIPATHLCGVDSNQPVTKTCQNSSTPEGGVETCTSTDVSGYSGSCSSPVVLASSNAAPVVDVSVTAASFTNSPPGSPLLSRTGAVVDPKSAINSSSSPDSPEPPSSPAPPLLCPPFQCTQDEEALTLLLQVPDIDPHSLKGEVDTNHYRVSFVSKDSVPYTLLLHFPPENKLTSPETGISVSLNNAVIHLTKAPETAGLWTKLYFGLNEDSLQTSEGD